MLIFFPLLESRQRRTALFPSSKSGTLVRLGLLNTVKGGVFLGVERVVFRNGARTEYRVDHPLRGGVWTGLGWAGGVW